MNEQEPPIRTVLNAYVAAVYAKDVEAFVGIYDADVHVFDAWGQWQMRVADALREMATGWFGWLGDERVVVELNDVAIIAGDNVAWGHAAITLAGERQAGSGQAPLPDCLSARSLDDDD